MSEVSEKKQPPRFISRYAYKRRWFLPRSEVRERRNVLNGSLVDVQSGVYQALWSVVKVNFFPASTLCSKCLPGYSF